MPHRNIPRLSSQYGACFTWTKQLRASDHASDAQLFVESVFNPATETRFTRPWLLLSGATSHSSLFPRIVESFVHLSSAAVKTLKKALNQYTSSSTLVSTSSSCTADAGNAFGPKLASNSISNTRVAIGGMTDCPLSPKPRLDGIVRMALPPGRMCCSPSWSPLVGAAETTISTGFVEMSMTVPSGSLPSKLKRTVSEAVGKSPLPSLSMRTTSPDSVT
mmetsp:Transcript_18284/g.39301  ORF Transcript_18284/g.39301 Transcript_18284/m.39301 type:complete len:219 (-) Transcript_18284:378-1034(-)